MAISWQKGSIKGMYALRGREINMICLARSASLQFRTASAAVRTIVSQETHELGSTML